MDLIGLKYVISQLNDSRKLATKYCQFLPLYKDTPMKRLKYEIFGTQLVFKMENEQAILDKIIQT